MTNDVVFAEHRWAMLKMSKILLPKRIFRSYRARFCTWNHTVGLSFPLLLFVAVTQLNSCIKWNDMSAWEL